MATRVSTLHASKAQHIGLWVAQVALAAVFLMAGGMKIFAPIDELAKNMAWVSSAPALVRFIGTAEVLGALGLLLPSLTRIRPELTPLAALGLLVIMVLATGMHLFRGEVKSLPVTLALGALAAYVAWGRHQAEPIPPRE